MHEHQIQSYNSAQIRTIIVTLPHAVPNPRAAILVSLKHTVTASKEQFFSFAILKKHKLDKYAINSSFFFLKLNDTFVSCHLENAGLVHSK